MDERKSVFFHGISNTLLPKGSIRVKPEGRMRKLSMAAKQRDLLASNSTGKNMNYCVPLLLFSFNLLGSIVQWGFHSDPDKLEIT